MPLQLLRSSLLLTVALGVLAAPARAGVPLDGVFDASNGLSGPYRLIVPEGPLGSDSVGLLLFFHADGDVDGFRAHADNLAERGEKSRLAVAALTVPSDGPPPTEPADQCWWAPRPQSNAEYVGEWIENVALGELGDALDFDRVYFAGISGGGDFAAAVNLHLDFRYGGGAVALCGGDMPRANGGSCVSEPGPPLLDPLPGAANLPPNAAEASAYSFDLTKNDSLRPLALAARDYYEGLGFEVLFGDPAGSGHCGFAEPLEQLLDRRIERVASLVPPDGCTPLDLSDAGAALLDDVPLVVAQQAIPEDDPERATLLAGIQEQLDAVAALRAEIPDAVSLCQARTGCSVLKLTATKREIGRHLGRLKRRLVPKALAHSADPTLRKSLRDTNRASHQAKKAALRQIPGKLRLCEG
jgi:hypothetical protein